MALGELDFIEALRTFATDPAARGLADDAAVDEMLEVNLRAPIRLMRAVVPLMKRQGAGAIVNIGSVAGEIGIAGTYSATKFALRGLTD